MKRFFLISSEALEHLSKDEKMKALIEEIGVVKRELTPDLFRALISSIISQMISTKAAVTIFNRVEEKTPITPEGIFSLSDEELRSLGVSLKKAKALREISRRILEGELDLEELRDLSDKDLKKKLVELPFVGPWTAEMLMIFSLERPNVLSFLDLGIRRGIERTYEREATKDFVEELKKTYHPYESVASLYLWEKASLVL